MEYNKNQFQKSNDKKVMHKVKKHWVIMSMALLMAFGGKAVAMHVSANADTTDNDKQSNLNTTRAIKNSLNHQLIKGRQQTQKQTQTNVNNASRDLSADNIDKQASLLHDRILQNASYVNAQRQNPTSNGRVKDQTAPDHQAQKSNSKKETVNANQTGSSKLSTVNPSSPRQQATAPNNRVDVPSSNNDKIRSRIDTSVSEIRNLKDVTTDIRERLNSPSLKGSPAKRRISGGLMVGSSPSNPNWTLSHGGFNADKSYLTNNGYSDITTAASAHWDNANLNFYEKKGTTQGVVVVSEGAAGGNIETGGSGHSATSDGILEAPSDFNNASDGTWQLIVEPGVKLDAASNSGQQFSSKSSKNVSDWNKFSAMDLRNLDMSSVKNISNMFQGDTYLKSVALGNGHHTSSGVTNMQGLFDIGSGSVLHDININGLDTSSVTNMSKMFAVDDGTRTTNSASSDLTQLDLPSTFKTDNASDLSSMFEGDNNLQSIRGLNFKLPNATDMSSMFRSDGLNALDLTGFDVRNSGKTKKPNRKINMSHMIYSDNNLPIVNGIANSSAYHNDLYRINYNLVTPQVSDASYMLSHDSNLLDVDASGFNLSDTKNVNLKDLMSSDLELDQVNFSIDIKGASDPDFGTHSDEPYSDTVFYHDQLLNSLTANIQMQNSTNVNMSHLFGCKDDDDGASASDDDRRFLKTIDVSKLNSSNAKNFNMSQLFENDQVLTKIKGISPKSISGSSLNSDFVTPGASNLSQMFLSDNALTKLDVSKFNLKGAPKINMNNMFENNKVLSDVNANINMSGANSSDQSPANMSYLFNNNPKLTHVNVSDMNTNGTKDVDMNHMFNENGKSDAAGLTVDGIDSTEQNKNLVNSNSNNLSYMFNSDKIKTPIDISYFNLDKNKNSNENVPNLSYMFNSDTFTQDASSSSKPGVTADDGKSQLNINSDASSNLNYMFNNNSGIKDINAGINIQRNTGSDNLRNMFISNANLRKIDVSGMNTDGSTNMAVSDMFNSNGNSSDGIDFVGIDNGNRNAHLINPNVTNSLSNMFYENYIDEPVNISKFNMSGQSSPQVTSMFDNNTFKGAASDYKDHDSDLPNASLNEPYIPGVSTSYKNTDGSVDRMNLSNTTSANFSDMFYSNVGLRNVNASINLEGNHSDTLNDMFNENGDLRKIDVSDMTTRKNGAGPGDPSNSTGMTFTNMFSDNGTNGKGIDFVGIDNGNRNGNLVNPNVTKSLSDMFYKNYIDEPVNVSKFSLAGQSSPVLTNMFNQNTFQSDSDGQGANQSDMSKPGVTTSYNNDTDRMNLSKTSSATLSDMFNQNTGLKSINANINLESNQSDILTHLFNTNADLRNVDVSDMTTNNAKNTNMSYMFNQNGANKGIQSIRGIDNSDQNPNLVLPNTAKNLSYMFNSDTFAKDNKQHSVPLNISKFNLSGDSDADLDHMFYDNKGLTNVEMAYGYTPNGDPNKAANTPSQQLNLDGTTSANLSDMFNNDSDLFGVDANFKMGSAKQPNMTRMFDTNANLRSISMTHLDTSSASDVKMQSLFNSDGNNGYSSNMASDSSDRYGYTWSDKTHYFEVHGMSHSDQNSNLITPKVSDMSHMFTNDREMRDLDVKGFNVNPSSDANVKMNSMFDGDQNLPFIIGMNSDFSSDDFSNAKGGYHANEPTSDVNHNFVTHGVKDMSNLFNNDYKLRHLDIDGFNVDKKHHVKADHMFHGLHSSNHIQGMDGGDPNNPKGKSNPDFITEGISDLSDFFSDDSTDGTSTKHGYHGLDYVDISQFDTRNVSDMNYMFNKNAQLDKIRGIDTSDYFGQNSKNHFTTSDVNKMHGMFTKNGLSQLDIRGFRENGKASNIDMSYLLDSDNNLNHVGGLTKDGGSTLSSDFVTDNVANMNHMFNDNKVLSDVDISKFALKNDNKNGNAANPNKPHGENVWTDNSDDGFDAGTSGFVNMRYLFNQNPKLNSVTANINMQNANQIDMNHLFNQNSNLTSVDMSGFDTTHATHIDMPYMFTKNTKLPRVKGLDSSDPSSTFITQGTSDLAYMFNQNSDLSGVDIHNAQLHKPGSSDKANPYSSASTNGSTENGKYNLTNRVNMSDMFYKNGNLAQVNANLNMAKIDQLDMSDMFNSNSKLSDVLANLNLNGANSSKSSSMDVEQHNLDKADNKVTSDDGNKDSNDKTIYPIFLHQMFNANSNLKKVDMQTMDTRDANYVDLDQMFNSNQNLTHLDGLDYSDANPNLITNGAVDLNQMFNKNTFNNSTVVDLAKANLQSDKLHVHMHQMFNSNPGLTKVYADGMNMKNTSYAYANSMFNSNPDLARVDAAIDLSGSKNDDLNYFFNSNPKLTTIDLNGNVNDPENDNPNYNNTNQPRFSTKNATDVGMSHFFNAETALTDIMGANNGNPGNGARNVDNGYNLDSDFVTPGVSDISYMFNSDKVLSDLDVMDFNVKGGAAKTSNGRVNVDGLFSNMSDIQQITGLNGTQIDWTPKNRHNHAYNTGRSDSDSDSRYDPTSIAPQSNNYGYKGYGKRIDNGNLITSDVHSLYSLFADDPKLDKNSDAGNPDAKNYNLLDLTAFDTKNVSDMQRTFASDPSLKGLKVPFNTSKVSNNVSVSAPGSDNYPAPNYSDGNIYNHDGFYQMFQNDPNMKVLDISSFDIKSNSNNMVDTFTGDNNLTTMRLGTKTNLSTTYNVNVPFFIMESANADGSASGNYAVNSDNHTSIMNSQGNDLSSDVQKGTQPLDWYYGTKDVEVHYHSDTYSTNGGVNKDVNTVDKKSLPLIQPNDRSCINPVLYGYSSNGPTPYIPHKSGSTYQPTSDGNVADYKKSQYERIISDVKRQMPSNHYTSDDFINKFKTTLGTISDSFNWNYTAPQLNLNIRLDQNWSGYYWGGVNSKGRPDGSPVEIIGSDNTNYVVVDNPSAVSGNFFKNTRKWDFNSDKNDPGNAAPSSQPLSELPNNDKNWTIIMVDDNNSGKHTSLPNNTSDLFDGQGNPKLAKQIQTIRSGYVSQSDLANLEKNSASPRPKNNVSANVKAGHYVDVPGNSTAWMYANLPSLKYFGSPSDSANPGSDEMPFMGSNVSNMNHMFYNDHSLSNVAFPQTGNVTDANGDSINLNPTNDDVFYGPSHQINQKVSTMDSAFDQDPLLVNLDLSGINTQNATTNNLFRNVSNHKDYGDNDLAVLKLGGPFHLAKPTQQSIFFTGVITTDNGMSTGQVPSEPTSDISKSDATGSTPNLKTGVGSDITSGKYKYAHSHQFGPGAYDNVESDVFYAARRIPVKWFSAVNNSQINYKQNSKPSDIIPYIMTLAPGININGLNNYHGIGTQPGSGIKDQVLNDINNHGVLPTGYSVASDNDYHISDLNKDGTVPKPVFNSDGSISSTAFIPVILIAPDVWTGYNWGAAHVTLDGNQNSSDKDTIIISGDPGGNVVGNDTANPSLQDLFQDIRKTVETGDNESSSNNTDKDTNQDPNDASGQINVIYSDENGDPIGNTIHLTAAAGSSFNVSDFNSDANLPYGYTDVEGTTASDKSGSISIPSSFSNGGSKDPVNVHIRLDGTPSGTPQKGTIKVEYDNQYNQVISSDSLTEDVNSSFNVDPFKDNLPSGGTSNVLGLTLDTDKGDDGVTDNVTQFNSGSHTVHVHVKENGAILNELPGPDSAKDWKVEFKPDVKAPADSRYLFSGSNQDTNPNFGIKRDRVNSIDLNNLDTSAITKANHMFASDPDLAKLHLSTLGNNFNQPSNNGRPVSDLSNMFASDPVLKDFDVNGFNTSTVKTMNSMFKSDKAITNLDLHNFVTSNVSDLRSIFYDDPKLRKLNLQSWNLRNINNNYGKNHMFGDNELNVFDNGLLKIRMGSDTKLNGNGQDFASKFFSQNVNGRTGESSTEKIINGVQTLDSYYYAAPVGIYLYDQDHNTLPTNQTVLSPVIHDNSDDEMIKKMIPLVEGKVVNNVPQLKDGTYTPLPMDQQNFSPVTSDGGESYHYLVNVVGKYVNDGKNHHINVIFDNNGADGGGNNGQPSPKTVPVDLSGYTDDIIHIDPHNPEIVRLDPVKLVEVPSGYKISPDDIGNGKFASDFDAELTPNGFKWLHTPNGESPTVHFIADHATGNVTVYKYLLSATGRILGIKTMPIAENNSINTSYMIAPDRTDLSKYDLGDDNPLDGVPITGTVISQYPSLSTKYINKAQSGYIISKDGKPYWTNSSPSFYYIDEAPKMITIHYILNNGNGSSINPESDDQASDPEVGDVVQDPYNPDVYSQGIIDEMLNHDFIGNNVPNGYNLIGEPSQYKFGKKNEDVDVNVKGDLERLKVEFVYGDNIVGTSSDFNVRVGDHVNLVNSHTTPALPKGYYVDRSYDTTYHVPLQISNGGEIVQKVHVTPSGSLAPVIFIASDGHVIRPDGTSSSSVISSNGYAIGSVSTTNAKINNLPRGYHFVDDSTLNFTRLVSDNGEMMSPDGGPSRVAVSGNPATVHLHYIDQNGHELTNVPLSDQTLSGQIDFSGKVKVPFPSDYVPNNKSELTYNFSNQNIKSENNYNDTMYDYNVYVHQVHTGIVHLPVNIVYLNNDKSSDNQLVATKPISVNLGGGYVGDDLKFHSSDLQVPAGYTQPNSFTSGATVHLVNGKPTASWDAGQNPTVVFVANQASRKIKITQIKELPDGTVVGVSHPSDLNLSDKTSDKNVGNAYDIDPYTVDSSDNPYVNAPAGYQLVDRSNTKLHGDLNRDITGRITANDSVNGGLTNDHATLYYVAKSDSNDITVNYVDDSDHPVPARESSYDFNNDGTHYYGQQVNAMSHMPANYSLDSDGGKYPNQQTVFTYGNSSQTKTIHVKQNGTNDMVNVKLVFNKPDDLDSSDSHALHISDLQIPADTKYTIRPNDKRFDISDFQPDPQDAPVTENITAHGPSQPNITFYYHANQYAGDIDVTYVDQNGNCISDGGNVVRQDHHLLRGYRYENVADVTQDSRSPMPYQHQYLAGNVDYTFGPRPQRAIIMVKGDRKQILYRYVNGQNNQPISDTVYTDSDPINGYYIDNNFVGNQITLPRTAPNGYYLPSGTILNYRVGPDSNYTIKSMPDPSDTGKSVDELVPKDDGVKNGNIVDIDVLPKQLVAPVVFQNQNGSDVGYSSVSGLASDTSDSVIGLPNGYAYKNAGDSKYNFNAEVKAGKFNHDTSVSDVSDTMQSDVIPVVGKSAEVHVYYVDQSDKVVSDYESDPSNNGNDQIGNQVTLKDNNIDGGKYTLDNGNDAKYTFNASQIANGGSNPVQMNDYIIPVHGSVVTDNAAIKIMEFDPYGNPLYSDASAPVIQVPVTGEIGDSYKVTGSDVAPGGFRPAYSDGYSDVLSGTIQSDGSLSKGTDEFYYISNASKYVQPITVNYENSDTGQIVSHGLISPNAVPNNYDGKHINNVSQTNVVSVPGGGFYSDHEPSLTSGSSDTELPKGYTLSGSQDLSADFSKKPESVTVMVSPTNTSGSNPSNSDQAQPINVTYWSNGSQITNPYTINGKMGDLINVPSDDHVPEGYYLASDYVNGHPLDAYPITNHKQDLEINVKPLSNNVQWYQFKVEAIVPKSDANGVPSHDDVKVFSSSDSIPIKNGDTLNLNTDKYNPAPGYYSFVPGKSSTLSIKNNNGTLTSNNGTLVYQAASTNSDSELNLGTITVRFFDGGRQVGSSHVIDQSYDGQPYTVEDLISKYSLPNGYSLNNAAVQKNETFVLGPSSSHQNANIYIHGDDTVGNRKVTVHVVKEGPSGSQDKHPYESDVVDTIDGNVGDVQTINASDYLPQYPAGMYQLDTSDHTHGNDSSVVESIDSDGNVSQPNVWFYYRAKNSAIQPINVTFENSSDGQIVSDGQQIQPTASDYDGKVISDVLDTGKTGIVPPSTDDYTVDSGQNLKAVFSPELSRVIVMVSPKTTGHQYSDTFNVVDQLYSSDGSTLIGMQSDPQKITGYDGKGFTVSPTTPQGYTPMAGNNALNGKITRSGLYVSDGGGLWNPQNEVVYKFKATNSNGHDSDNPNNAQPIYMTYKDEHTGSDINGIDAKNAPINGYMGESVDALKSYPIPAGYHLADDQTINYTISNHVQNATIEFVKNSTTDNDVYHYDIEVEDPNGNMIPEYSRAVKVNMSNNGSVTIDPTSIDPIAGDSNSKNYYSDITPSLADAAFKVTDHGGKFTLVGKAGGSVAYSNDPTGLKLIYKAKPKLGLGALTVNYYDGGTLLQSTPLDSTGTYTWDGNPYHANLYYGERVTSDQLAGMVQPPKNFIVNANQDRTYVIGKPQTQTANIYVHGAPNDPGSATSVATITINEEDASGNVINSYTVPDHISGERLDHYVIEPNAFVPKGYQATASDNPVAGIIKSDGTISPSAVTFNYRAAVKAQPIYVSYVNQSGQKVISDQQVTGDYGDTVNDITTDVPVPGDYTLVGGQNVKYTFTGQRQHVTLQVQGVPTQNTYTVDITEHNGSDGLVHLAPRTVTINGHVGDVVHVHPEQYLPEGYHLDPDDHDEVLTLEDNSNLTDPDAVHFDYDEDAATASVVYEDIDDNDYVVDEKSIYGDPNAKIDYAKYSSDVPDGYEFDSFGSHDKKLVNGDVNVIYVRPKVIFSSINIKYVLGDNPQAQSVASDVDTGVIGSDFDISAFENNLPDYLSGYQFKRVLLGGNVSNYKANDQTIVMELEPAQSNYGTVTVNYVDANNPNHQVGQEVVSGYDGEQFDLGAYEYNAPQGWYYHDILYHKYVDNFVKGENQVINVEVKHS